MNLSLHEKEWNYSKENACWYLEDVVYVKKPKSVRLQNVNIFVPQSYRSSGGRWNWDGTCGRYNARTAPIILENGIGGYAESHAKGIKELNPDALEFLREGMVYVSPGTRGKQSKDEHGTWIGKAPAGLVDLKSVVRFLKHNQGVIPGNTERIISMGVSAGGAMSALLGVTGDNDNYKNYLEESGAVMESSDNIFAAQCYCPIIDLEHADMAYEWMFRGIEQYQGRPSQGGGTFEMSAFQKTLSEKLAERYVEYFNGLGLVNPETGEHLCLEGGVCTGGKGSGDRYLLQVLQNALNHYLKRTEVAEEEINELRKYADRTEGGYVLRSREEMVRKALARIKPCTAFDSLSNDSAENQEFGSEEMDFKHFNPELRDVIKGLEEQFPEECALLIPEFADVLADSGLKKQVYLLNPLSYIGTGEQASMAKHIRIRVGTKDPHTSFTVAMILALKLKAAGHPSVDYEMIWNAIHEKADIPGGFLNWVKSIV